MRAAASPPQPGGYKSRGFSGGRLQSSHSHGAFHCHHHGELTGVDTRSGSFSSNTQYLTARCCSSYQHPSLLLNGSSFNKELSKDLLKKGEITMSISSTALICGDWKTSMKMLMEILGREDLRKKKVKATTMSISSTALTCGGWMTSMSRQKEFRRLNLNV